MSSAFQEAGESDDALEAPADGAVAISACRAMEAGGAVDCRASAVRASACRVLGFSGSTGLRRAASRTFGGCFRCAWDFGGGGGVAASCRIGDTAAMISACGVTDWGISA